ncbi:30S ribosomal protein S15 [Methanoplanus sp. FWC-SCC4]|uniref:Small ribosomal subunit protein uS15 n=1 Tax=Methanochimaera problematica TaxID=2609417 RepID=A0AA97FDU7_9EURY|nr:30S ribosomal protein S15 [Methanoplanus sp. FWC-SCC4]WOF15636.1 30S ribosomal protein S15 [Methanoplanus sp. FWC-SCC4]
MARMHARRRGTSKSVCPLRTEAPEWSNKDTAEIQKIIIALRKEGKSSAEIGLILRDKYGVPSVKLATGKRVDQLLEENGLASDIPEDLRNLIVKALGMRKHIAENKKDVHNKRQLHLTEAKVRRLGKYYVKAGKMPAGWTYKPDTAEFLLSK